MRSLGLTLFYGIKNQIICSSILENLYSLLVPKLTFVVKVRRGKEHKKETRLITTTNVTALYGF